MNAVMRAYLPEGTDHQAIEHLMLGQGGYTIMKGCGIWQPEGDQHPMVEDVSVFECIVSVSGLTEAGMQLAHAGRVFLNDNRNERAFLGVVIGDGVKQIYLEQEQSQ